jgi:hypothetical protein
MPPRGAQPSAVVIDATVLPEMPGGRKKSELGRRTLSRWRRNDEPREAHREHRVVRLPAVVAINLSPRQRRRLALIEKKCNALGRRWRCRKYGRRAETASNSRTKVMEACGKNRSSCYQYEVGMRPEGEDRADREEFYGASE